MASEHCPPASSSSSAILATVVYLTLTKTDIIEGHHARTANYHRPDRERALITVMAVAAIAAGSLLSWASAQPHTNAAAEKEGPNPAANANLTPQQSTAAFPKADVAKFRTLVSSMDAALVDNDEPALNGAVDAYEKAWDDDQPKLEKLDKKAWGFIDSQNDAVFTSVRETKNPDAEKAAVQTLLKTLGG